MANEALCTFSHAQLNRLVFGNGSEVGYALDSAYVHLTSGDAVGIRFMAPVAAAIDEVYVYIRGYTGTKANVTMRARVYSANTTNAARAGSTLHATSTATAAPSGSTGWVRFTFGTPYTPARGDLLWIVIDNTAASPTVDYPSIRQSTLQNGSVVRNGAIGIANPYVTANGFSGNGSAFVETPFVIKLGSTYVGNPWTTLGTVYASNTRKRGIVFTPATDVVLFGIEIGQANSTYAGVSIFRANQAPSDTPIHSTSFDSGARSGCDACAALIFDSDVTLIGGVTYYITLTFSSNTTAPSVMSIEDYSTYQSVFATLIDAAPMSAPHSVIDDGAGGWTVNKSYQPCISPLIKTWSRTTSCGGG